MRRKKQLFLDRIGEPPRDTRSKSLWKLLNWNIRNPSVTRAIRQVEWIRSVDPDVIVLTEIKRSKGTGYISDRLQALNYSVRYKEPDENRYGSLLASKYPMTHKIDSEIEHFGPRVVSATLNIHGQIVDVIGVYVHIRRGEKKRRFLENLLEYMKGHHEGPVVFCGDFNILEPDHVPHYTKFEEWEYEFYERLGQIGLSDAFRLLNHDKTEYSWVGNRGEGYRYDHLFISANLLPRIVNCRYLHDPREDGLSDHSGMIAEFKLE